MAHAVELHPGDILVIRRADGTPPDEEEIARLSVLASDLDLVGVLILGVDDCFDGAQRIGVVETSGGGIVGVAVDRDLARYPEDGQVVYVGAKEPR